MLSNIKWIQNDKVWQTTKQPAAISLFYFRHKDLIENYADDTEIPTA